MTRITIQRRIWSAVCEHFRNALPEGCRWRWCVPATECCVCAHSTNGAGNRGKDAEHAIAHFRPSNGCIVAQFRHGSHGTWQHTSVIANDISIPYYHHCAAQHNASMQSRRRLRRIYATVLLRSAMNLRIWVYYYAMLCFSRICTHSHTHTHRQPVCQPVSCLQPYDELHGLWYCTLLRFECVCVCVCVWVCAAIFHGECVTFDK